MLTNSIKSGSSFMKGLSTVQKKDYYGSLSHMIIIMGKISIPLLLCFITFLLSSSITFFSIRHESILMTQSFSIFLLYFNCLIVGTFWGGSLGFQISGSQAFGEKRKKDVGILFQHSLSLTFIMSIIFSIFTYSTVPYFINKKGFLNEYVSECLNIQFKILAISIPFFTCSQVYNRLSMITQNTDLCFYSGLFGLIIHAFSLFLFNGLLDMPVYSIGLSYLFNFIALFAYLVYFFYNDNLSNIMQPFSKEYLFDIKGLYNQLKYGLHPFLNYIFFVGSIEAVSMFGLLIDEINFTVLTIYMNILSIIIVISEALSNTMSMLSAYFIGKRNGMMLKKVFKTAIILSTIVQLIFISLILLFPKQILSLYSTDSDFLRLGLENINIFALSISLNSYHFVPSEFIVVFGNQLIPLYSVIIGKYIVQFGGAYIFAKTYKLRGIMYCMCLGQLICLAIFAYYIYYHIDFNNFSKIETIRMISSNSLARISEKCEKNESSKNINLEIDKSKEKLNNDIEMKLFDNSKVYIKNKSYMENEKYVLNSLTNKENYDIDNSIDIDDNYTPPVENSLKILQKKAIYNQFKS